MRKCIICGNCDTGHSYDRIKSCLEKIDETRTLLRKHALDRGWTDLIDV